MLLNAYRRFIILFDWLCFRVYARKFEVVGRENEKSGLPPQK